MDGLEKLYENNKVIKILLRRVQVKMGEEINWKYKL